MLFVYKRLDTLENTVQALQKNSLADKTALYVFSDNAKKDIDQPSVNAVRNFIRNINGFASVEIIEAPVNKGLAKSIIEGVSEMITRCKKVIVLEDDLVTSPNFLSYMNQALDHYEHDKRVFSISGFTMPMKSCQKDFYVTGRSSSWGWASWLDRWEGIDWEVKEYESFRKDFKQRGQFNQMGSDMSGMLDRQMAGEINSWAIRWCFHQFRQGLYTIYPATSKVMNIGLENIDATHTNEKFSRFKTVLDKSCKEKYEFDRDLFLDRKIIKQFRRPYSIPQRVKYKILNILFK